VGKRRTNRRTGRDDGVTFMVHVTVNVTLYDICVYTLDGEEVCFCREYTHYKNFFAAPSMDRNWRGSAPRSDRHRTASIRARPDID